MKALAWIDSLLNRTTMYRVVLYYCLAIVGVAVIESLFGLLPYGPLPILVSVVFIMAACVAFNELFAWGFDVPLNAESAYITALILALIITPPESWSDVSYFWMAGWSAALAMAAKFLLATRRKHLFNPAAAGVAIMAATVGLSASWWVATGALMPVVLIGGILMVRKLRRADLVLSFFAAASVVILWNHAASPAALWTAASRAALHLPLFFFAFVMLTEPLTTPPTRPLRILYGAFTGFLFTPALHIGSAYFTPELALLAGNLFSWAVSPKEKLLLSLASVRKLASDTYEFVFAADRPLRFRPGQYLEWTLAHGRSDTRGNRRYFTIASAPGGNAIALGVKFYPQPSSFKTALTAMRPGDTLAAGQLAGDFTLPRHADTPLVFLAGGIGVTPFASMTRHMLESGERRPVTLLYGNRTADDIAYADLFEEARARLGMKVVYVLSDAAKVPAGWKGKTGFITADLIRAEVPDWASRTFYISGPQQMVSAYRKTLRDMGVSRSRIHTDFFPGFA